MVKSHAFIDLYGMLKSSTGASGLSGRVFLNTNTVVQFPVRVVTRNPS